MRPLTRADWIATGVAVLLGIGAAEFWIPRLRHRTPARGSEESRARDRSPLLTTEEPVEPDDSEAGLRVRPGQADDGSERRHPTAEQHPGSEEPGGSNESAQLSQRGPIPAAVGVLPDAEPPTIFGRAGAALLHGFEYVYAAGDSGVLLEIPERQEKLLSMTEEYLYRMQAMGEPPWHGDRFQIIASLLPGCQLAVVGRDFAIPSSPEAAMEILIGSLDRTPSVEGRQTALNILRDWEVQRRLLLAKIINRALGIHDSGRFRGQGIVAYGIVNRRAYLIRSGESPELELLIRSAARIPDEMFSEARDLVE